MPGPRGRPTIQSRPRPGPIRCGRGRSLPSADRPRSPEPPRCPASATWPAPDRRDGLHRAGRRPATLKATGKEVVELEIGDSPFPSTPHAKAAGIAAIEDDRTGYGPSLGLPEFRSRRRARSSAASSASRPTADHVVVASGAKPFEQYFAEALLEPDDGVLIFSPQFPTYVPNLRRVGARPVVVPLQRRGPLPAPGRATSPSSSGPTRGPGPIFLNSPHNPTGGVATGEDLDAIADLVRGTDLVVFSDEPYCHMVWEGRHESILARPGMMEHVVAAYTFSKSYSMSGWRIGFAVAHPEVVQAIGKLINTTASCSPPFVQLAAAGGAGAGHARPATTTWTASAARSSGSPTAWRGSTASRSAGRPGPSTSSPTSGRSATGWA